MKVISIFLYAALSTLFVSAFATTRRVRLPFGSAVEGVTHVRGDNFILSDTLKGRMMLYDSKSDLLVTVVRTTPGRTFQGIHFDEKSGYVFAAGSGYAFSRVNNNFLQETENRFSFRYRSVQPSLHAFDLIRGNVLTCTLRDAGVVNDVVTDPAGEYAYFTDSLRPWFYRVRISLIDSGRLSDFTTCSNMTRIELPKATFGGDGFYASGLAFFKGGLVIPNFNHRSVWYYNLAQSTAYEIVRGEYRFGNPVGVKVVYDRCLITVDNMGSALNVFRIKQNMEGRVYTTFVQRINSTDFSEPTTFDVRGRTMVIANFDNKQLGSKGRLWLTVKHLPEVSDLCA